MKKSEFKNIDLIKASRIYAKLQSDVNDAGILDRSYFYYAGLALFSFAGFFASFAAVYFSHSYLTLVLSCFSLTMFSVQLGGLVHDSGHRAIFKGAKANDLAGYIFAANILTVYDSWKQTHNAHHAKPNQVKEDPDMEIPFISFNTEGYERKTTLEKLFIKYQAYFYYPILSFAALSLRLGRITYYKNFKAHMWWHFTIYIAGLLLWFVAPFFVFNLAKALFFVLFINVTMGIYMSNIFAPNHKGMPELEKGKKLSFLEQQITTARNVKGGLLTDFFLLGLNYQAEHHLFPNCPRNKLRLITPYLKKVCKELNMEYTVVSFVESNKIIIKELHSVSLAI